MKRILLVFVLVTTGALLAAQDYKSILYYSYCDEPIRYRIDSIDSKFSVTKEDFMATAEKAAKIWNDAWNTELLIYDPTAELSLNLVYDERQELTSKINSTKSNLEQNNKNIEAQIDEYEMELIKLEERIEELNKEVEYWNNNGGAPEDVYKKLVNEQDKLWEQTRVTNIKAQELNHKTTEYNSEVENLNNKVSDFNNLLDAKPEEGLYIPTENKIEIYIVNDAETLKHTVAHEFGHAIGIEHVEDPESLMFATVSNAVKLSDKDMEGLNEVCRERNRVEEIFTKLSTLYSR